MEIMQNDLSSLGINREDAQNRDLREGQANLGDL